MRSLIKPRIRGWADQCLDTWLAACPFEVSYHTVTMERLPEAFHGWTVAQISDLHIDRWNTTVVEAAIDVINHLKPDLLVCTGDVIAEGPDYLADVTHLLKQFAPRHGKFACLGNHDYSDGREGQGVRKALIQAGFEVLVNESTLFTLQHQRINIAGADDYTLGEQCLTTTTRHLDADYPTLLLNHNPENFDVVARLEPDLVLSGHTHGGQVHLPNGIRKLFFNSPYIAGHYQHLDSRLYVNRGLGSAVFIHHMNGHRLSIPTPRLFMSPEISLFTLVQTQGQGRFTPSLFARQAIPLAG